MVGISALSSGGGLECWYWWIEIRWESLNYEKRISFHSHACKFWFNPSSSCSFSFVTSPPLSFDKWNSSLSISIDSVVTAILLCFCFLTSFVSDTVRVRLQRDKIQSRFQMQLFLYYSDKKKLCSDLEVRNYINQPLCVNQKKNLFWRCFQAESNTFTMSPDL